MNESKIIIGRDNICRAYGIGKRTFQMLVERGAPIKMLGNRHSVHRDDLDEFIRSMVVEKSPSVTPSKVATGKK